MLPVLVKGLFLFLAFRYASSQTCKTVSVAVCKKARNLGDETNALHVFKQEIDSTVAALATTLQKRSAEQQDSNFHISNQIKDLDAKVTKLSERANDLTKRIASLLVVVQLPTTPQPVPLSCAETTEDGVHSLPSGQQVYCSKGWTVFQRRDGSIRDFHNKTWEEYASGFGDLTKEYWMGLRTLHEMTAQGGCRLRADLKSYESTTAYAEYKSFSVANETDLFRIRIAGYKGTAGDALTTFNRLANINGMAFTTNDRDNDRAASANCASFLKAGGWWHNSCFRASPNAIYGRSRFSWKAMIWYPWIQRNALQSTVLKVRCD